MGELLEHEVELLRNTIREGVSENDQAALDMTEAVADTNAWHDNAAYDEVIERMKLIDARYTPILKMLGEVSVVNYPEITEEKIQLGSLLHLNFEDDLQWALLVGQVRAGIDIYQTAWEDDGEDGELLVVSSQSPLGEALIGKTQGDVAEYKVNDTLVRAHIHKVRQDWISRFKK